MIRRRLEIEAGRNWDIFYKNNTTNFYKDRHYLLREFNELSSALAAATPENKVTLLDLGCGVGNAFWPMVEHHAANVKIQCCDFSKKAVSFINEHKLYNSEFIDNQVCDIVNNEIPFEKETAHFSWLIFVLSAIAPTNFDSVAAKIHAHLAPDSYFYFRDYGRYDLAQMRFAEKGSSKIEENFYVRLDKTRAYYFTIEQVQALFESVGFKTIECKYVYR